jgi:hypothetical protein
LTGFAVESTSARAGMKIKNHMLQGSEYVALGGCVPSSVARDSTAKLVNPRARLAWILHCVRNEKSGLSLFGTTHPACDNGAHLMSSSPRRRGSSDFRPSALKTLGSPACAVEKRFRLRGNDDQNPCAWLAWIPHCVRNDKSDLSGSDLSGCSLSGSIPLHLRRTSCRHPRAGGIQRLSPFKSRRTRINHP